MLRECKVVVSQSGNKDIFIKKTANILSKRIGKVSIESEK
jgi:hypothetical protein